MTNSTDKRSLIPILCVLFVVLMFLSIILGSSGVGAADFINWLSGAADSGTAAIIRFARIPRTFACVLAGGALAVSGLLLQTALSNPLASPGVIGVNAGSGLFVVLAASVLPPLFWIKGLAAFLGAFCAAMTVYLIAKKTGSSRITIVLAGVAVSSMLTAFIDAVTTLWPDSVIDKTAFYIGGFSAVQSGTLDLTAPVVIIAMCAAFVLSRSLELLLLGDEVASSLGLNVGRCRFAAILLSALLSAAAVSIAGLIGFVGLIVPHITRLIVGTDIRRCIPVSALIGACLTLLCDILARILFAPFEIPAGILLSLIGAPFFLHLVLSRRKKRYD